MHDSPLCVCVCVWSFYPMHVRCFRDKKCISLLGGLGVIKPLAIILPLYGAILKFFALWQYSWGHSPAQRPLCPGEFYWLHELTLRKQCQTLFFWAPKSLQMVTAAMKLRRLFLGRKVMTNLDSIFKSRDITLPTKVCLVKAMVFPVVIYGCESWTVKKAECRRIDAFELWRWRRLLRVPWTVRRSNQSILKEISPGISWKEWC